MTDRPRVLVTETVAEAGLAALTDGGVEVDVRTDLAADREGFLSVVGGYEGLIVRSATRVDREVVEAGTRLQVIGRAGIGVDNVDLEAATRRGVLVVNAPQGNIISAAELTVGMLLALARRIPQAHASLIAGDWDRHRFMGAELHDKVLGVVGLGRIGTLVAQRCLAFGMHVIAHDPYVSEQRAARLGIELVSFDDLLARADAITVHVVKSPETLHMIGRKELERCRPGVFIVNTSRGGVIDEDALADAIRDGRVGGAALDVFETEPPGPHPLFSLDRVVVTPHLGASTVEAQDKAGTSVAEQVLRALRGEFVPNAVNLQAGRDLPDHLRAYVGLAEKLGRLACALAGAGAEQVEIEYLGKIAEEDTRVFTLSALRGFLQPTVHEPVTYVNAPVLAADRGLAHGERRTAATDEYVNLIRVVARRDGRVVSVGGTLGGRQDEPRLVEIDGKPIEITLTRYMAFFRYADRPGVVHKMSGPLAAGDINIKNMVVAEPTSADEDAIMALAVDSEIPPELLEDMMREAGIPSGRFVTLP